MEVEQRNGDVFNKESTHLSSWPGSVITKPCKPSQVISPLDLVLSWQSLYRLLHDSQGANESLDGEALCNNNVPSEYGGYGHYQTAAPWSPTSSLLLPLHLLLSFFSVRHMQSVKTIIVCSLPARTTRKRHHSLSRPFFQHAVMMSLARHLAKWWEYSGDEDR